MSATAPEQDPAETVFGEIEAVLSARAVLSWPGSRRRRLANLLFEYLGKVSTQQQQEGAGHPDAADDLPAKRKRGDAQGSDDDAGHEVAVPEYEDEQLLVTESKLYKQLTSLKSFLHAKVPYGSVSETTFVPQASVNFEAEVPTFEVDAFLYDDNDIDALCDGGKLSRDYCLDCKSVRIGRTQLISHSFSLEQLIYIFGYMFPRYVTNDPAKFPVNKLVDVGSRFGIVLAAAHAGTAIPTLRGIEISEAFVQIQRDVIAKQRLAPRASVVCADVLSEAGLAELRDADVVFLHNVFEWFVPEGELIDVWRTVARTLRPGQIIVASPSLEDSLKGACAASPKAAAGFKRGAFLKKWVAEIDTTDAVTTFAANRADAHRRGHDDGHHGCGHDHEHGDDESCSGGDDGDANAAADEEEEECIEMAKGIHLYRVAAQMTD